MCKVSIPLSCFVLVFVTSVAMAMPATTSQMWTFSNANNPADPDPGFSNVYGKPVANLGPIGDLNFGWLNVISGRQGVWAGGPLVVELIVPNNPIPNAYKKISLEMDFKQVLDGIEAFPYPMGVGYSVIETYRSVSLPDSDGWKTLNISWQISPNPNGERICIGVSGTGGLVDSISVETACVPEPATLALLGLGTMILLRRKRK